MEIFFRNGKHFSMGRRLICIFILSQFFPFLAHAQMGAQGIKVSSGSEGMSRLPESAARNISAATAAPGPIRSAPGANAGFEEKKGFKEDLQGPFYLVDETPAQAIKIYEALSKQIALQSPELPNVKINFSSNRRLPRSEAILAFKSLLAVNGIAIVPMGERFFKAVPITGVNAQAPAYLFGRASDLPTSQFFYSKLYELKYLDINTFKDVISPFISPNDIAALAVFPRTNAFLLTDTLANHQRIEMLLDKIDIPAEIREEIGFFTLKNMSADEFKKKIDSLSANYLKKYFEDTSIESDERTNQIIVVTPRGNMKNIQSLIEKFDVDSQPLTKSEVFYIKHGESKDVASVLNEIVKGQQQAVKTAQKTAAQNAAAQNAANRAANARARASGNAAAANRPTNLVGELSGAALQFSDYITIVADERSNSIVVYGTPTDLKQIGDIISKIDVVLAQVKIDVIITEVTLTDKQVSGLSNFGLNYSLLPDDKTNKKGWSGNTSTLSLSDTGTSAFTVSADEYSFGAVFNIAQQNETVKVLSAPSVVTTHNKDAVVNVSRRYPFITSSTDYSSTVYPTSSNTVDWRDVGITLEVKPLIGENGIVQLEIKQTVSTVVGSTYINNTEQSIVGTREAESFVSAMSGETIILAGLQQVNNSVTDGEVWLLADLPLIGDLFKPDSVKNERTELIIFIRPTLIKSTSAATTLASESIGTTEVSREVKNYFKSGKFHDVETDDMGKFEHSSFVKGFLPKQSQYERRRQTIQNNIDLERKESANMGKSAAKDGNSASPSISGASNSSGASVEVGGGAAAVPTGDSAPSEGKQLPGQGKVSGADNSAVSAPSEQVSDGSEREDSKSRFERRQSSRGGHSK